MLLADQRRAQRAEATIAVVIQKGRHLLRVLGDVPLSTLTPRVTADYADQRVREGASRHTAKKELGVLRQAVKAAGLPWAGALMPDLGTVYTPRERWLTRAEYEALLNALWPGDERTRVDRRPWVIAWCHLGVRASELYGITWPDVDLEGGTVRVRGTKTRRADRVLPVNAEAREAFEARQGRPRPFPAWGNVRRDLHAACKRAGIAPVTPNDLRRTFASWLANAGVPVFTTSRLMGHASTAMVEKVYARLGQTAARDAVSSIVLDSAHTMGTARSVRSPESGGNGDP